MAITNTDFLRHEALDMLNHFEKEAANMTAQELEIVTARLTDLRVELKEMRKGRENARV